jgi:hypothetical protein
LLWIGEILGKAGLGREFGGMMGIERIETEHIEVLRMWRLLESVAGSSSRCRCGGSLVLGVELRCRSAVVAEPVEK